MALPLKRTLGSLRAELQMRLGFGMSGQAGIVNSPIIDSFLRSAQEQLYVQADWRELCAFEERQTGIGQTLYDYPPECNVERIQRVAIWNGGSWIRLQEGISIESRGFPASPWPTRYERFDQMEIWPTPDSAMWLRREYVRALLPFSKENDRTSLPSEEVFLLALYAAKAHYRQPDSQIYKPQVDTLLTRLKQQHRGRSVWEKDSMPVGKGAYYSSIGAVQVIEAPVFVPSPAPTPGPAPAPAPGVDNFLLDSNGQPVLDSNGQPINT